jgi:hypothetical protein
MNKRIVLIIGLVVVFVIGIIVYFIIYTGSSSTAQQVSVPSQQNVVNSKNNFLKKQSSTIVRYPTPDTSTPEQVTAEFYNWWISYPENPLSSGAYKTSKYLTGNFISLITFVYSEDKSTDPVICPQNKTKFVVYTKAVYDSTGENAQVTIESSRTGQNLQQVDLQNFGGSWYINDIVCE